MRELVSTLIPARCFNKTPSVPVVVGVAARVHEAMMLSGSGGGQETGGGVKSRRTAAGEVEATEQAAWPGAGRSSAGGRPRWPAGPAGGQSQSSGRRGSEARRPRGGRRPTRRRGSGWGGGLTHARQQNGQETVQPTLEANETNDNPPSPTPNKHLTRTPYDVNVGRCGCG